jgi:multicomponent Na+:H+ antiporter subunit D
LIAHFFPPLPVAIPLLAAALVMGTSKHLPRWLTDAIAIGTAVLVLVVCVGLTLQTQNGAVVYWFGGWQPQNGVAIGISFSIDAASAILAGFIALLFVLTFTYSAWYFDDVGRVYHVIMLAFLGAMCGFTLTGDVFNMFVFFELMSAAAFGLCGYKIEEEVALAGTINFAITNTVGAFFMLFGIALVYGKTGALNMAQIGASLGQQPLDSAVIVAFGLICLGLAVKGAIVPLHMWLSDAHAVAPTPLCVLFSGIMVQIALYAIARVYWTMFSPVLGAHAEAIRWIFVIAGVVTIVLGGVMAFLQTHLKRLLAFSTVSHSGIFLCGIGFLNPLGMAATLAYVISHGLVKASLFMGTGSLLMRFGTVDERKLAGKTRGLIWGTILFLAGGLALAGLPPFGDFASKALLEHASETSGFAWIAAALILGSALDGGAVIRGGLRIYFGYGGGAQQTENEEEEQGETIQERRDPPWTMTVPSAVALLFVLLFGAFGKPLDFIHRAGAAFVDTSAYRAAVLAHRATALPHVTTPSADLKSYVYEAITLALMTVFVVMSVQHAERVQRAFKAPVKFLRSIHSGTFTDYIAWMTGGAAVFAVLLFAAFGLR